MKKIVLTAALVILCGLSARAQGTITVTGTVTDSDSTVWANGACTAQYVIPSGAKSLTNSQTGQTISPTTVPCTLNGSGAFSITLVSTTYVIPTISGVTFTVCPSLLNSPCYSTGPVVIGTTSPQTVSSAIDAVIVAPRVTGTAIPQAYNDTEASAVFATMYARVSDNTIRCYTSSWNLCSGGGTGTVSPGTANQFAMYPATGSTVSGTSAVSLDSFGNPVLAYSHSGNWVAFSNTNANGSLIAWLQAGTSADQVEGFGYMGFDNTQYWQTIMNTDHSLIWFDIQNSFAQPLRVYQGGTIDFNTGALRVLGGGIISKGTQNVSGCSLTSATGGAIVGEFHSGTSGTCTLTITPGITAPNGWSCWANDITTPTDKLQQVSESTTAPQIGGTTVSGDHITWGCLAY